MEKTNLKTLLIGAGVYIALFYMTCLIKYYTFWYYDFDLAIHDQIMWGLIHGRMFNSILGLNFLGNHAHFVSFLVAPFYMIWPSPVFLLFLQTVFLAAGVFPLYALSRRYLDARLSMVVCGAYLLYPGLGFTNLYEFHPTCFAVFFLLCSAYYFYKEDFTRFNIFMALSLICQENIALIFVMWGIYAAFLKRPFKWVWVPFLLGLVYFLWCVYFVLPHFNKGVFDFFNIYDSVGGSMTGVIKTFLARPFYVLGFMFKLPKIMYLFQLFESVLFLSLLSPLCLLPAVLIFAQHLLSDRPGEILLNFHYTAEIIPFIFTSMVFGLRKILGSQTKTKYLAGVILLNAVVSSYILGPQFHLFRTWKKDLSDLNAVQKEKMVEEIPQGAPTVATFQFLPHLSHTRDLYSFHDVYSGFYTFYDKSYHLPDNVQYALIDFNDGLVFGSFYRMDGYIRIENFLHSGPWGVMDVRNNIVLFKKGIKSRYPLFHVSQGRIDTKEPQGMIIDKSIQLMGYEVERQAGGIQLVFNWKSLKPEKKDITRKVLLFDQDGRIIDRQAWPICYRIWPTQAWKPGQFIREYRYISLPSRLMADVDHLKIIFVDYDPWQKNKDFYGGVNINLHN